MSNNEPQDTDLQNSGLDNHDQQGVLGDHVQQPWVRNYQPGVPAEIELPTESLVAMFERSVQEAGDTPAMEFFGRQTSYRKLGSRWAGRPKGCAVWVSGPETGWP